MGGRTGSLVALMLHKILCGSSRSQIATSGWGVNVARKAGNLTTLMGRVKILGYRRIVKKKLSD